MKVPNSRIEQTPHDSFFATPSPPWHVLTVVCLALAAWTSGAASVDRTAFPLDIPPPQESEGGIIVTDVNDDGHRDILMTVPGHLAVYSHEGKKLWVIQATIGVGGQSESQGLPGHHGPGVVAGDVDGDGATEVVFVSRGDSVIHVLDGKTGREEARAKVPAPEGTDGWELALIADFRGAGDDADLLLQTTNNKRYRMGRYLAAYAMEDLLAGRPPLWTTDEFVSCAHNGARLSDLDGDGRDEILGATIFSHDGKLLVRAAEFRGHMDSVFVADVRPEVPGWEVVMLEEGSNEVQVLGLSGLLWRNHYKHQEPQNAVIGRFKKGSDEIFVWCRSRYNEHQKPFVFNARGDMVFEYAMDDVAPEGWTASGMEVIHRIDWTGERQQLACAKERHRSGDVGLFEPLTGRFVEHFPARADRLYVADVKGDWREEIVILQGNELVLLHNTAPNPRPDQPSLWTDRNYRRLKQGHNYYSP